MKFRFIIFFFLLPSTPKMLEGLALALYQMTIETSELRVYHIQPGRVLMKFLVRSAECGIPYITLHMENRILDIFPLV